MPEQGCCFPCTHILAITDFLRYNSHTALQDADVVEQKSCLFHSQTHDFLVLIWKKAASLQLLCHPIIGPTFEKITFILNAKNLREITNMKSLNA